MNKIYIEFENNFWGEFVNDISISSDSRGCYPWFVNIPN